MIGEDTPATSLFYCKCLIGMYDEIQDSCFVFKVT